MFCCFVLFSKEKRNKKEKTKRRGEEEKYKQYKLKLRSKNPYKQIKIDRKVRTLREEASERKK